MLLSNVNTFSSVQHDHDYFYKKETINRPVVQMDIMPEFEQVEEPIHEGNVDQEGSIAPRTTFVAKMIMKREAINRPVREIESMPKVEEVEDEQVADVDAESSKLISSVRKSMSKAPAKSIETRVATLEYKIDQLANQKNWKKILSKTKHDMRILRSYIEKHGQSCFLVQVNDSQSRKVNLGTVALWCGNSPNILKRSSFHQDLIKYLLHASIQPDLRASTYFTSKSHAYKTHKKPVYCLNEDIASTIARILSLISDVTESSSDYTKSQFFANVNACISEKIQEFRRPGRCRLLKEIPEAFYS